MSLLAQVKKGKIATPDLVLIYGVDGVGKSTFAAAAPACIFIGTEKGTSNLDVARYPKEPKQYEDVIAAIEDLTNNPHEFKSVAFDSLDWFEPMVWDKVCRDSGSANIEAAFGGYGKGYVAANKYWQAMIEKLSILREKRGMNIIIIAHSMVKAFNDPQSNATYDRFQLKLNDKAGAIWREFVDSVFFANYEVYTKEDGKNRTRAYGEGVRLLYTERRPGYDAKNRLALPPVLALDWNAYQQAKASGTPEAPEVVTKNVAELMAKITDPKLKETVEKFVQEANGNVSKLIGVQNRLRVLLSA